VTLIDDEGRLFGAVNVIDALVVCVILATVVAGIALVDPFEPAPDPATRHATLDLGAQQPNVAALVDEGDAVAVGTRNLTVQDVHYAPLVSGDTHVYARVEIPGEMVETDTGDRVFHYGGTPLRVGSSVELDTSEYTLSGTVRELSQSGTQLDVEDATVLVETTTRDEAADDVTPGDTYRVAGQRVGSIETVQRYPTTDPGRERLHVGLALSTIAIGGDRRFGRTVLRTGEPLTFDSGDYVLNGSILELGTVEPRGNPSTVGATVELRDVEPAVARSLSVGSTERLGGRTSRVTNVTVEPATVVVESDDGQVYGRDHPRLKDVTLEVDLAARQAERRLYFHGRIIQEDRPTVLEFGLMTVEGRITDLER
jgi:hypothetical protein